MRCRRAQRDLQPCGIFMIGRKKSSAVHAAACRGFNQAAVICNGVIKAETAGKIIAVIAVSGQDPAGDVAAEPALADDIDRFLDVKLL